MTKKDALTSVKIVKEMYQESKKEFSSFEEFAAACLMMDVSYRGHINHIFGQIYDEDRICYNDIKKTWKYIIRECFDDFSKRKEKQEPQA